MRKYQLIAIVAIVFFAGSLMARAETITEGQLNIQRLATQISGDLKDYSQQRDGLVDNIKSVQKGIQKLRKDYARAESEKDRLTVKARTLEETSRLLDFYDQFYALNIQKVEAILPNLEKMRQAARKGAPGKAARQLQDPEFKRNINTLYRNLSTFAMRFHNAKVKKEVATLLKENELLYHQGKNGLDVFDDIIRNIDKVANYLRSAYARTVQRANILERKKMQAELAVELMQYALALKPIQQTMLQVNAEGVIDVPEIDLGEFVDPIISDGQSEGDEGMASYNDPDVDSALKSFQNGPNFLR